MFRTPPSLPATAAVGALVLAALFLLLYICRRERFVLHWVTGWAVIAAGQALAAVEIPRPALGLATLGLAQFLGIAGIGWLGLGAGRTRPHGVDRRYLIALLPGLLWFGLAPVALGVRAAVGPGYLISAAGLGFGAGRYLGRWRRDRRLGAGLTGAAFVLLTATNLRVALGVAQSAADIAPELMVANAGLYLVAALGMIILVVEEMAGELRGANRRLEAAQAELREQAITDPLTGCHNRRFFDEVIGRELQRHGRYGLPLSLLFVDIDRFKAVNDSLGHAAGDRLLQHVARFLRRHVREADYVFRWGGDEFLLMLSCRLDAAEQKARQLKRAFQDGRRTAPAPLPPGVGLSIGCSEVTGQTDDILGRVREADRRMYADKRAAREPGGPGAVRYS